MLQVWPSYIFLWKCYQYHGLCSSTASLILTTPYHTSTSLSFHNIPTMRESETVLIKLLRAYNSFECHLEAILTSWIAVETSVISEQTQFWAGLGPAVSSVWGMDQLQPNPPTLISNVPEETRERLWLKWEKKSEWIQYYSAAKVDNLGWNSFSSMTDPVHAANTHKSTHFCELCWKETCISWNPIGKPVLWIAYYFTNKTLRLMTY